MPKGIGNFFKYHTSLKNLSSLGNNNRKNKSNCKIFKAVNDGIIVIDITV
jgi:hypothetical protein